MSNINVKYRDVAILDKNMRMDIVFLVPMEEYLKIIKNNPNKYRDLIKGANLNKNSKLLYSKVPREFLKEFDERREPASSMIIMFLQNFLTKISKDLEKENVKLDNDLSEYRSNEKKEILEKSYKIFRNEVESSKVHRYMILYAKLRGIELSLSELTELISYCLYQNIEKNESKEELVELKGKLKKSEEKNKNYSKNMDKLEKTNKALLDSKEKISKEYREKISSLEEDLEELKKTNETLKLRIEDDENRAYQQIKANFVRENSQLVMKNDKLKNDLLNLNRKKIKLEQYKNNFMENFEERLFSKYVESEILEKLPLTNKEDKDSSIYEVLPENLELNLDKVEELEDYIYGFSDNLDSLRVRARGMSNIELASFLTGIHFIDESAPLLCGNGARNLAKAFSMAYAGQTPHIINLSNGYDDTNYIKKIIDESDSDLILIENYQGGINDNLVLNLIREDLGKVILFSIEDRALLDYIPNYMFRHLCLFNVHIDYEMEKKNNYKISRGIDYLNKKSIDYNCSLNDCRKELLNCLSLDKVSKYKLNILFNNICKHSPRLNKEEVYSRSLNKYIYSEYHPLFPEDKDWDELYEKINDINSKNNLNIRIDRELIKELG